MAPERSNRLLEAGAGVAGGCSEVVADICEDWKAGNDGRREAERVLYLCKGTESGCQFRSSDQFGSNHKRPCGEWERAEELPYRKPMKVDKNPLIAPHAPVRGHVKPSGNITSSNVTGRPLGFVPVSGPQKLSSTLLIDGLWAGWVHVDG